MSETNDTTRPSRKTLSLKKTETSTVKQSFSHGRTKAVVVEKKRARAGSPGKPIEAPELKPAPTTETASIQPISPARDPHRAGVVLRQLTEEEKEARTQNDGRPSSRKADGDRSAVGQR